MHASIRGYYANRGCAAHEVPADEATAREDSTALTQRSSCRNAAASFFCIRRRPSPESSAKAGYRKPRLPNRSRSFGLERRSDRTQARDCGYYENRNPEACKVRDDDSTALTHRSSCRNAAASFFIQIGPASLGSDLSRTASPLRASGGHFDTCGDSGILARK